MRLFKYHALGNDYFVLDAAEHALPSPEATAQVCHRHYGLGSDGILYGPLATDAADFGLRILNPDGSEAEKSGNGLRIFCRYLLDEGKVGDAPFTIETPGGVVTCRILDGAHAIEVEMGRVSFR
ncbi:MAG: diaminopimelate epimerase, partial [Opitutales bacterium]